MSMLDLAGLAIFGWIVIEVIKAFRGNHSVFGHSKSKNDSSTWDDLFDLGWDDNKKVKALKHEVSQLKERVATLEAIVTDEKYHLKREIDQL